MKHCTNYRLNRKAGWLGALTMALLTTMALAPALWAQESSIVRDYGDYNGYDSRFADWVDVDPELDVEIWTDNESGSYYEGESIQIYFRANFDCYVAIYNIDSDGRVNLIYPFDQYDEPLIEAGRIYRIPDRNDDYELLVQGPEGVEDIQIVASRTPFPTPDWYESSGLVCDQDRDEYLDYINGRYFGCRSGCYRATDRVSFEVKRWDDYYYRPVYYHPWPVWRSYGWVYVDYAWGSSIYIDGYYYGIAPLYLPRISLGHHVVTVYDSYGHCWEGPITVHRDRPLHLDNTIIRTGAGVKSRYRSVRKSAYRAPERHGYRDVKITSKYKPRTTSKTVTRKTTTTATTTKTTRITDKTTRQVTKGKDVAGSAETRGRGFQYKRVDRTTTAGKVKSDQSTSSESRRLKPYKTRSEKSTATQKRSATKNTRGTKREKATKSGSSASKRKKSESRSSGTVQQKRSGSPSKSAKTSKKGSVKKSEKKTQKKSSTKKAGKAPPPKSSSSVKKAPKAGKKDPPRGSKQSSRAKAKSGSSRDASKSATRGSASSKSSTRKSGKKKSGK